MNAIEIYEFLEAKNARAIHVAATHDATQIAEGSNTVIGSPKDRESVSDVGSTDVGGDALQKNPDGEAPEHVHADAEAHRDADTDADADADADAITNAKMDADADLVDPAGMIINAEEGDGGFDMDAEGEPDDDVRDVNPTKTLLHLIRSTSEYLCAYNDEEDTSEPLAVNFQRLPNRRVLPDYFDVIKDPIAFSTVRAKLLRKAYTSFSQFVRDVAQICHNAQVYNRPSAPVFSEAERLRDIFRKKLQHLLQAGDITADEAILPDLGELPPVEDSPPPENDDSGDEDDSSSSSDDIDNDGEEEVDAFESNSRLQMRRQRYRRRLRKQGDKFAKKRGRPPKVFTPAEARISKVLQGLCGLRNDLGELRICAFEKLPDKISEPEYHSDVQEPISLHRIKNNVERKKYATIDQFLSDLDLLFSNAIGFEEVDSQVYKDAIELKKQARIFVAQEKVKPDDMFRDEEGRLRLDCAEINGQTWRVGDWVLVKNPNDMKKPIVAQIFILWQDANGHKWVNTCWYYRPEQTVHRLEKFFYENEVVKTANFRDHPIEEIGDRCFVMFVTRYPKGRPRGFPTDKEVFVCESRYDEHKHTFSKIKTWSSCLPEEVRGKDYEMDFFDVIRPLKKVPSPIKHLLHPDAKETDDLPKPTWASPNAPPLIGAVHNRPREPEESPPPEPMAVPLVPTLALATEHVETSRRPSMPIPAHMPISSASLQMPVTSALHHSSILAPPGPSASSLTHSGEHHFASTGPRTLSASASPQTSIHPHHFQHTTHQVQGSHSQPLLQQTPLHLGDSQQYTLQHTTTSSHLQPNTPQQHQQHQHRLQHQFGFQHHTPTFDSYRRPMQPPAASSSRHHMPPATSTLMNPPPGGHVNQYNQPQPAEVYTLSDVVDIAIPTEMRDRFQRDDSERVIFFTSPPQERSYNGLDNKYANLGHSVTHLASLQETRDRRARKRRYGIQAAAEAVDSTDPGDDFKRQRFDEETVWAALIVFADEIDDGITVLEAGLEQWHQQKAQNTKGALQQPTFV